MEKWFLVMWACAAFSANGEFFGQQFVGGVSGEKFAVSNQTLSKEEAWSQYQCDSACGEACLSQTSGPSTLECVTFCGCIRFITAVDSSPLEVISETPQENLPEACVLNCATLCGDNGTHCVNECLASFCVALPAEKSFWYLISVGVDGLAFALVGLCLFGFYKKMKSKRRRRLRLSQAAEGTYRML